jgi:hypothetical protein
MTKEDEERIQKTLPDFPDPKAGYMNPSLIENPIKYMYHNLKYKLWKLFHK